MKLTDQIKSALAKKQAQQHPDSPDQETNTKARPGRAPVLANKPQKRVTGRGR